MFEKEAKERAEEIEANQTLGVYDNDEDLARDEGWNDGYVSGYEEGFQNGAEFGYNKAKEEENEKSNVLLSDIIEAFTSRSYNDDFEMAQAGREIYELFYGGKDPKEVFHNAEVPKCSRQLLKEAKDIIYQLLMIGKFQFDFCDDETNYYNDCIVKNAEDFIKPKENE